MDPGRIRRGVARRAGRGLGLAMERFGISLQVRGARTELERRFSSLEELTRDHSTRWSDPDHSNRRSLEDTLALLGEKPAVILETGSSAWGTKSSQLFDAYVGTFGGEFATVDLRMGPMAELRSILTDRSSLARSDSVRFLDRWVAQHPGRRADLVYLDSWDLDALDPLPAVTHGLNELLAVLPALWNGSLVLVDDSPNDLGLYSEEHRPAAAAYHARTGLMPGKAMLIDLFLAQRPGAVKMRHGYQVLYRLD